MAAMLVAGCAGHRVAAPSPAASGSVSAPGPALAEVSAVEGPAVEGPAAEGPAAETTRFGDQRQVPSGWIGGVAEATIARSCDVVARALRDPDAYWALFANTRAVEPLGVGSRGELLVTMEQGYAFASGRYVAHVLEVGPRRVVAWIEPIRNVRDGWMEIELAELGPDRCHVSMFTAADLGEGLVVRLFRKAIEGALLMTPELVRAYVEQD